MTRHHFPASRRRSALKVGGKIAAATSRTRKTTLVLRLLGHYQRRANCWSFRCLADSRAVAAEVRCLFLGQAGRRPCRSRGTTSPSLPWKNPKLARGSLPESHVRLSGTWRLLNVSGLATVPLFGELGRVGCSFPKSSAGGLQDPPGAETIIH